MDKSSRIEAVKGVIASLFASQRTLRAIEPGYKWAGLGNLLGDFGEFVAMHAYNLDKASPGSNGFDAKTKDGKSVQVKTNHSASQIGFRGEADLMLVMHVHDSGEWEEIYFGPFGPVKDGSRYSGRDNKQMIAVSKLRAMALALKTAGLTAVEALAISLPNDEDTQAAQE